MKRVQQLSHVLVNWRRLGLSGSEQGQEYQLVNLFLGAVEVELGCPPAFCFVTSFETIFSYSWSWHCFSLGFLVLSQLDEKIRLPHCLQLTRFPWFHHQSNLLRTRSSSRSLGFDKGCDEDQDENHYIHFDKEIRPYNLYASLRDGLDDLLKLLYHLCQQLEPGFFPHNVGIRGSQGSHMDVDLDSCANHILRTFAGDMGTSCKALLAYHSHLALAASHLQTYALQLCYY